MWRLQCKAQQYAWGKLGSSSKVAQLQHEGEGAEIKEDEPYAEYWFGTHPNGPSSVTLGDGSSMLLSDFLKEHPEVGGSAVEAGALPYLMKVLSVAKALSIQAHPDKPLAEKLHADRPDVYKDPNHKPEMACALTPFEGMCGFRSLAEVQGHLESVPELATAVGPDAVAALRGARAGGDPDTAPACVDALRALFTSLMKVDAGTLAVAVDALTVRLDAEAEHGQLGAADALAHRLTKQYPGDVGVFAPYLLNIVTIQPGEAFFMAANEPHAYLSGDCIECMACSDNVVRAGLTPKLRDVDTLTSMLTYRTGRPDLVPGKQVAPGVTAFVPPVPEFAVQRVVVDGPGPVLPPIADSASIWLVIEGTVTATVGQGTVAESVQLESGAVYLQAAGSHLELTGESALLFRSHTKPSTTAPAATASAAAAD